MEDFEKEPGMEGEYINMSIATRGANIIPDPSRLEMYDEYKLQNKIQERKHRLLAFLFLAPAAALLFKDRKSVV